MALTDKENQQIDEMIAAYERTIKFIRGQVLDLKRQKITFSSKMEILCQQCKNEGKK